MSGGRTATSELPAAPVNGRFPLSSMQEVFCSDERHMTDRFIVVNAWRVRGRVDTAALQGALDDLVARHEILRSVFGHENDGSSYQQVMPPCAVPLLVADIEPFTGRSREIRAEELIIEAEVGRLDPYELPLIRAELHRFDDQDSVFVLVHHHLGMDGRSVGVGIRDLAEFYAARVAGREPKLPEVKQAREFAAWQRARSRDLDSAEGAAIRAYWRDRLAGAQIFTLPTDRPMPPRYSQPYSEHVYDYDEQFVASLAALARQERCSLFMVLLAGMAVLAHEVRGATDTAFRVLTSGRNEAAFQETVGLLIDFLPVRVEIADCTSFRDVLRRARAAAAGAFTHEIPMGEIAKLAPELTRPEGNPSDCFMNFIFHQQPSAAETYPIGDGAVEIRERVLEPDETGDMPFGASWNTEVIPSGRFNGGVLYNRDEFDASTIARWTAAYHRILAGAVADPGSAWREL
ncbi:condensation domain-containing protein [Catellatospora vulcania]|uniref:condensation domain-containing protein n=1 Tax=Catellatospora vulcania TaxID=1460450 RepID=UPI0012D44A9E|nr:condensation domain-containing protein [Catellatospora vulcania]